MVANRESANSPRGPSIPCWFDAAVYSTPKPTVAVFVRSKRSFDPALTVKATSGVFLGLTQQTVVTTCGVSMQPNEVNGPAALPLWLANALDGESDGGDGSLLRDLGPKVLQESLLCSALERELRLWETDVRRAAAAQLSAGEGPPTPLLSHPAGGERGAHIVAALLHDAHRAFRSDPSDYLRLVRSIVGRPSPQADPATAKAQLSELPVRMTRVVNRWSAELKDGIARAGAVRDPVRFLWDHGEIVPYDPALPQRREERDTVVERRAIDLYRDRANHLIAAKKAAEVEREFRRSGSEAATQTGGSLQNDSTKTSQHIADLELEERCWRGIWALQLLCRNAYAHGRPSPLSRFNVPDVHLDAIALYGLAALRHDRYCRRELGRPTSVPSATPLLTISYVKRRELNRTQRIARRDDADQSRAHQRPGSVLEPTHPTWESPADSSPSSLSHAGPVLPPPAAPSITAQHNWRLLTMGTLLVALAAAAWLIALSPGSSSVVPPVRGAGHFAAPATELLERRCEVARAAAKHPVIPVARSFRLRAAEGAPSGEGPVEWDLARLSTWLLEEKGARMLIKSAPGLGKSTFARRLAASLCGERRETFLVLVAVPSNEKLKRYRADPDGHLTWLLGGSTPPPGLSQRLVAHAPTLLLDGLDEATVGNRQAIHQLVETVVLHSPSVNIVVFSGAFPGMEVAFGKPFDEVFEIPALTVDETKRDIRNNYRLDSNGVDRFWSWIQHNGLDQISEDGRTYEFLSTFHAIKAANQVRIESTDNDGRTRPEWGRFQVLQHLLLAQLRRVAQPPGGSDSLLSWLDDVSTTSPANKIRSNALDMCWSLTQCKRSARARKISDEGACDRLHSVAAMWRRAGADRYCVGQPELRSLLWTRALGRAVAKNGVSSCATLLSADTGQLRSMASLVASESTAAVCLPELVGGLCGRLMPAAIAHVLMPARAEVLRALESRKMATEVDKPPKSASILARDDCVFAVAQALQAVRAGALDGDATAKH